MLTPSLYYAGGAYMRQAVQSLLRLWLQHSASMERLWAFGSAPKAPVQVLSTFVDCTDSEGPLGVPDDAKEQAAVVVQLDVRDRPATQPRTCPRPLSVQDYLCPCGECPGYKRITLAVASSTTSWRTEREQKTLTELLHAFSTYNEVFGFRSDLIAAAHKRLYLSNGHVDQAFQAFVANY